MKTLEQALINVNDATDGAQRRVRLHTGPISADSLRDTTREFMRGMIDPDTVFLSTDFTPSKASEVAAWSNLALLAQATAAAVAEDPTPHTTSCYVYKHARALLGKDRRGLCTCGAEQANAAGART